MSTNHPSSANSEKRRKQHESVKQPESVFPVIADHLTVPGARLLKEEKGFQSREANGRETQRAESPSASCRITLHCTGEKQTENQKMTFFE